MTKQIFKTIALGLCILTNVNLNAQKDSLKNLKPTELSMKDAIDKGLLEVQIMGVYDPSYYYEIINGDGIHFGKCMGIYLNSKIDSTVMLRLDCGTQLIPNDSLYQTMIVTHKVIFALYPNSHYTTKFYAMCGQLHDKAPNYKTPYSIGELSDSGTVKLAQYLSDNYIQSMIGQHAVWAFTDQANFEELKKYGADSISIAKTKEILRNVNLETKLTPKVPPVVVVVSDDITLNPYIVYSGLGIIVLLTTATIILIVRRKKKTNINA